MKENEQKKDRENNLILFNIPEATVGNGKQRQKDDEGFCDKILKDELGCENNGRIMIKDLSKD